LIRTVKDHDKNPCDQNKYLTCKELPEMKKMKPWNMLYWFAGLAILISSCSTPLVSGQPTQAAREEPENAQAGLREVIVENVSVEIGVGSPIPVEAVVSGTWPGLCAQLAEVKQQVGDASFDIRLLATPDDPTCPEDHLGLPFRLAVPLNMAEKPIGSYTVTVNGVSTSFEWNQRGGSIQPDASRFTYESVGLTLDPAFASGAVGQLVPENPGSADGPYWEVNPQYVSIALDGYPLSGTAQSPVIAVYPVEDFRRLSPQAKTILDNLKDFLALKPASAEQIPFLPVWNAGQTFLSNMQYLDFQNGSGVRFLTIYAQYPAPVNNQDLFYAYQGLTADGRYAVSVILPVNHASLPASADALSIDELQAIAEDYGNYRANAASALSAEPDSSFLPDLAKLDALVQSLNVER